MPEERYCHIHQLTLLQCPRCIAAKGGRTTAKRHSHAQLAKWGRMGGRGRKKPAAKKKKSKKKSRRLR